MRALQHLEELLGLVDVPERQQSADRVQAVGVLVVLLAQHVDDSPHRVQLLVALIEQLRGQQRSRGMLGEEGQHLDLLIGPRAGLGAVDVERSHHVARGGRAAATRSPGSAPRARCRATPRSPRADRSSRSSITTGAPVCKRHSGRPLAGQQLRLAGGEQQPVGLAEAETPGQPEAVLASLDQDDARAVRAGHALRRLPRRSGPARRAGDRPRPPPGSRSASRAVRGATACPEWARCRELVSWWASFSIRCRLPPTICSLALTESRSR